MERLQKVIANAGVTSRRKAEGLIVEGKVTVNGKVVTDLGTKVQPSDQIEVEGIPLQKEDLLYILLYKPRGVISSVSDDRGRKVVTDLLPHIKTRIYPIGRLDYDTSGLLLLTNDGEFANLMMHPKSEIEKRYIVKTEGIPQKEDLRKIERGIHLEDGKTSPAKARIKSVDSEKNTAIIEIIVTEGRNRLVRRLFEYFNLKVIKLKREQFGHLTLGNLTTGDSRYLTIHEVRQLYATAQYNRQNS